MPAADLRPVPRPGRETRASSSGPDASLRRHLLAIPVLLTAHNLEEVAGGLAGTRDLLMARAPAILRGLVGSPDAWYLAVALVTLLPWALLLLGGLARRDSAGTRALVVLQAGLALNVLSHVVGVILVGGYAPGVATALLLYVPFSFVFFRRAWQEEWVSRRLLRWTPLFAVMLHGPGLLGLLALCSTIVD